MTNYSNEKKFKVPTEYVPILFGKFDEYLIMLENAFGVRIVAREESLKIMGEQEAVSLVVKVLTELVGFIKRGDTIDTQIIHYTMDLVKSKREEALKEMNNDLVTVTYAGKPIKVKTVGQKEYIDAIKKNMIVFGVGPAGTGKTYLAMAMAVQAFRKNEVSKIILTRPAIEAGEKLGFLPGDLQSKVDPYLRPLYDALFEIMGPDQFEKNMEKGLIEVAPLAYMRGRTLNNAFIVLDEAQNTTPQQMKMFLTRLGFNCKAVVTGDLTQVDLPTDKKSGLKEAMKVLPNIDNIVFSYLTREDVVRHPLVQKIVDAYDAYDERHQKHHKDKK
ncbi:MAG: PhoH family protein [Cellulosilyticaceae bacterium]